MAELTNFALDATIPLLRPDSFVAEMVVGSNLWALYTPSSGIGPLKFSDNPNELIEDLEKVGSVVKTQTGIWLIDEVRDSEYWENSKKTMQELGLEVW